MNTKKQPDETPEEKPEEKLSIDVKFGKVTYISQEKGAFVQLLTGETQEVFVPKEVLDVSQNVSVDSMVQITKHGDEVVDIKSV
jgi:hypothetical protein